MNPVRQTSFTSAKSKKHVKNKIRGQQQGHSSMNSLNSNSNQNDHFANEKDKSMPIKDYAGISSETTRLYAAEQAGYGQVTKEACNILTEDINYKLRHIIHDCLVKSRLQGRDAISSEDVEEVFSDLNIEKVYGAPSSPNWILNRDRKDCILYQLDDQKVNLIQLAEENISISQEGDVLLDHVWLPDGNDSEDEMDEYNETFAEYFEAMCKAVLSDNEEIRHIALVDISTNSSIGPITDWFYHFSYFILRKYITCDHLAIRALQLLEVLENSPLPSLHVYGKQLKLMVRLLLQHLFITPASEDIVKYMSYVLSLFCLRTSLKNLVLNKIEDKLSLVCQDMAVPLLNVVYYIGIDAIKRIFLPNIGYFIGRLMDENEPDMLEIVLAIYGILCKANLNEGYVYEEFWKAEGALLTPYYRPKCIKIAPEKKDADVIETKKKLIKTRRKLNYQNTTKWDQESKDDVFDVPYTCFHQRSRQESHLGVSFKVTCPICVLAKKREKHRQFYQEAKFKKETQVTVGKTSLLLSVLKRDKLKKCIDHSLFSCHL